MRTESTLAVVVLDEVSADCPPWPLVDSGDGGRQFAGNLNAQACAGLVLHDPKSTIPNICALQFEQISRALAG